MAKFEIGDSVIHVSSENKGIIKKVFPAARGRQLYIVSVNGVEANILETNLIPNIDLTDPFERLKKGVFGSYQDFSKINTSFKIQNTSNNTISTLKASKTIFKAYQFKPLLKFLNSESKRLLVADEVGLGKTIEAGHIMLELMARRELKNSLIVCPKSLQEKWQTELKDKFNLSFKIYDSIKDLINDLKIRNGTIKAIVNYEKIRLKKDNSKRQKDLYTFLEENNLNFNFLLCDEAHRMRNQNTQLYKGAQKLLESVNSAVFLTATPIMISEENLFNLLKLLDPFRYSEYSTFHNQIAINTPFITALSQINKNIEFAKIASTLEESVVQLYYKVGEDYEYIKNVKIKELFNDIPLYLKIINDLKTKKNSSESRVQLQFDVSDMSEINKIFTRTRKKEVTQDWSQAERRPQTLIVELNKEERQAFDNVIEEYIEENSVETSYGEKKMSMGGTLGLIQKKRQVSSSIYAYLNDREDLKKGYNKYNEEQDAKFDCLIKIINEVIINNKKKLIVFALFKKTLEYLRIKLRRMGYDTALIHGDIQDRYLEIDKFKNSKSINILLSSEVGSEGLDMQFCDALVNYDLPWNPMVVEQRIGRIDRFGQKSPVVNIYNIIIKDSIQEEIYTRLLDRIGIFRGTIGDLEAILDKDLERIDGVGIKNLREWFTSLEKELYTTKLTEEQRIAKIDSIERAILTEKKNLENISEGLTDTLTNDVYFRNEIKSIESDNRYVTELELVNYLQILIRTKLKTCVLETIDENKLIYRFKIPLDYPRVLSNFLTEYQPIDSESDITFSRFKREIIGKNVLDITFSQDTAYNDGGFIHISPYHPIIIAAQNYFTKNDSSIDNVFQFALDSALFYGDIKIDKGDFLMSLYSISYEKTWYNRFQKTELMIPIVYDINNGNIIQNKQMSERILGISQLNSSAIFSPIKIDNDLVDDLRYILADEVEKEMLETFQGEKIRLESHKKMQIQRNNEFYKTKINNQKSIVDRSEYKLTYLEGKEKKDIERILPLQRKTLEKLYSDRDAMFKKIDTAEIRLEIPKLISLNLIKVY